METPGPPRPDVDARAAARGAAGPRVATAAAAAFSPRRVGSCHRCCLADPGGDVVGEVRALPQPQPREGPGDACVGCVCRAHGLRSGTPQHLAHGHFMMSSCQVSRQPGSKNRCALSAAACAVAWLPLAPLADASARLKLRVEPAASVTEPLTLLTAPPDACALPPPGHIWPLA
jgi:hypothetical protein